MASTLDLARILLGISVHQLARSLVRFPILSALTSVGVYYYI